MPNAFDALQLPCGKTLPNRLMMAPLTNMQSHEDGRLSDAELHWLSLRAQGGFGAVMTAAAYVQRAGRGFQGQIGMADKSHVAGMSQLATNLKQAGSVALMQLYHAGNRSSELITGAQLVAPSADAQTGARALSTDEIKVLVEDFINAALSARQAGFDGIEIHAAHGYIICQFLSPTLNKRNDEYGGSFENRCRLLLDIIEGVRAACGNAFIIGVRTSPERFGIPFDEAISLARVLFAQAKIDFLDLSIWDVYKEPNEERFQGRSLMSYFSELTRGTIKLGVAGKVYTPDDVKHCLAQGADFVLMGKASILNSDFASQMKVNVDYHPAQAPVTRAHLQSQGVTEPFMDYLLGRWPEYVVEQERP
jgi:2,4-dienoyl-CoA reductase-like NADH-dependent reductase (Old Yellow Enzyme family)